MYLGRRHRSLASCGWQPIGVALLFALVAGCSDAGPTAPGEGEGVLGEWVASGGFLRTYLLHLPPSYDEGQPAPLLILFHGAGDSGPDFQSRIAIDSVTDDARFITVYPTGIQRSWFLEDVQFTRTLIAHLKNGLAIDPRRVYVAGFSRGASFTHLLACTMSEELAGVAAVGATLSANTAQVCQPTRGVPIVLIQGTADPSFPWDGTFTGLNVLLSMDETVSTLTSANQCAAEPIVGEPTRSRRRQYGGDDRAVRTLP